MKYDRKVEIMENALYRLKERDYADTADVRRIDEFLALGAEFKVDLFDLIRFHAGPENCPGHVASKDDPKVCGRCGTHVGEYQD